MQLKKFIIRLRTIRAFSQLRYVLLVLGILMAANTLLRFIYLLYNLNALEDATFFEVAKAFVVGIRFDFATLFIVNGFLFLFLSFPLPILKKQLTYKISTALLLILNFPILVLNGIDIVYFSFSAKRMTHELFTGRDDLKNFGASDILPYWWLIFILLAGAAAMGYFFHRIGRNTQLRMQEIGKFHLVSWLLPLLSAGIMFVFIRGGVQGKPLRPANAFVSSNLFLGNLGLNTGYTVLTSIEIGDEQAISFFPQEEAIEVTRAAFKNDFDGEYVSKDFPLIRKASFDGPENKYNVVFLILESFNAEYCGSIMGKDRAHSLTPNLDSLAGSGMIFTNFFASGTRSVESLPSILNSQPDIFKRPLIGSSSETNAHWGIGNMLSERKYYSAFFCGGENGTVGFDSYSQISGFRHYMGQNEFPGSTNGLLCKWGIHDRPVLNWMADVQNKISEPFAFAWFSISNHFPFDVPQDCPLHIKKLSLKPSEKTAMYTDYAIGEYFKKVKDQPWFKNTIFVITADHCLYGPEDSKQNLIERFHVPLVLLGPGVPVARDSSTASHLSILPTLIELLKLDTHHASAGVSLLSKNNSTLTLSNMIGVLTLAQKNLAYCTTFENPMTSFRLENQHWNRYNDLNTSKEGEAMLKLLKCIYQVCYNARIQNKTFSPEWMK